MPDLDTFFPSNIEPDPDFLFRATELLAAIAMVSLYNSSNRILLLSDSTIFFSALFRGLWAKQLCSSLDIYTFSLAYLDLFDVLRKIFIPASLFPSQWKEIFPMKLWQSLASWPIV